MQNLHIEYIYCKHLLGMEVFDVDQSQLVQTFIDQIKAMVEQNKKLIESNTEKDKQITALTEEIGKLTAQVEALTAKIEELEHKKNSNNSSKPPSEERLDKPAPKSLRGKSDKKQGGQLGHKGTGMKIDRKPDQVEEHIPEKCKECPRRGQCSMKCCDMRYEYDVHVETKLIAHKVMGCTCPLSGEKVQGEFPSGITGTKQYGAGVYALVNTLLTVGYVSVERTKQLLTSLQIPISTGAIQNILGKAADSAKEAVERIKDRITGKEVVHFDETGLRVAGSLHWLHCACSGSWRFYTVQKKRGEEGMEAMGVLPQYHGVAVHDFWSSYKKFQNAIHAMCCQHLERELVFAEETGKQEWAGKLRKLLQSMCHAKNQLMADGRTAFTDEELQQYMSRYDSIVAQGLTANPLPERKPGKRGRLKKGKIRCLLERFQDCKTDILRFATDWRVPYTNNAAEQAIRFARVKEKVSGCFRTEKGAECFASVLSFISTAASHGISCFDACLSLRQGTALKLVKGWQD